MDFHLKQWRLNQHDESEPQQQHSAKIPKLVYHEAHHKTEPSSANSAALPLFVPEPNSKIISTLSAFPPDSTPASTARLPRMGSYFSLAQWQELELQLFIYRYMLAGDTVPPELLQPIKKSIINKLHTTPYFLHQPLQHYPHYQPTALFQSGYWGRAAMDPEPGRCRRTDGKKWRCSRDVVVGQKYCERHMHRGRNRSRKPVENPTASAGAGTGAGGGTLGSNAVNPNNVAASHLPTTPSGGTHFALSGPSSSIDLLRLNRSSSDVKTEKGDIFQQRHSEVNGDGKSDGHVLRHFFDDWPRSLQDSDNARDNMSPMNSATSLSISMPGNSSSDVSLKLSTGDVDELGQPEAHSDHHHEHQQQAQLGWAAGWASNPMASMGGPLAEALRSSNSNSSPTSVLHQLPRGSAAETCIVSS